MLIDILALDGVFDTGLAAVQDTFAIAAELGRAQCGLSGPILTRVVGVRRGVTTANGLKVPTQMASALSRPDVIVVPALARARLFSPKTDCSMAERRRPVGGWDHFSGRAILKSFSMMGAWSFDPTTS